MPVQQYLQPPNPDHPHLHFVLWLTDYWLQHSLWSFEPQQRMTLYSQKVNKTYR